MTKKQVALQKEKPFPFITTEGSLDSPGEMHLAADKQLFCSVTGSLIEPTLELLHVHVACYYYAQIPCWVTCVLQGGFYLVWYCLIIYFIVNAVSFPYFSF